MPFDDVRWCQHLERAVDREAVERMLLAFAVHPDAAAMDSAWLLVWDGTLGLLRGQRLPGTSVASEALGVALESARSARGAVNADQERAWRAFAASPAQLSGVPGAAWSQCSVALGAGEEGPMPWAIGGTLGAACLRREGLPFGLLIGVWHAPGDDAPRRRALELLGAHAAVALTAQERARTARRQAQRAAALEELARASVSTLNLAEVLQRALRLAVQGSGARGGAVWLAHDAAARLENTFGVSSERERIGRSLHPLAASVLASGKPRVIEPALDEPLLSPEAAADLASLVVVPLMAYGEALGVVAVYERLARAGAESAFVPRASLEFVSTLADLTAAVIAQARKFEEVRAHASRQRDLVARLRHLERFAALGEMGLKAASEARNPLASIGAFARRMQRTLEATDPNRAYVEIIMRESERLERMLAEQVEFAAPESPRLGLESLNGVIQEVLQRSAETLVRRRVRLLKKLSPEVPALLVDGERIRRVLGNVIESALDGIGTGGRIRIETRRVNQHVVVDVAHDGVRLPGEMLDQLFVPFAASRPGGPGVGLAVAQQIVREHGGEIRLRSEGDWSTVFSFSLPIGDNRDRRAAARERRQARNDRRTVFPEG